MTADPSLSPRETPDVLAPDEARSASPAEPEENRAVSNVVVLLIIAVLLGAGIWLVNALLDMKTIQDCVSAGRRNCAPIEAPPR